MTKLFNSRKQKDVAGYGQAVVVFVLSCHTPTLIRLNSKCQMAEIMFLAPKVPDWAPLLKVKIIRPNGGYIGTMWPRRTLISCENDGLLAPTLCVQGAEN